MKVISLLILTLGLGFFAHADSATTEATVSGYTTDSEGYLTPMNADCWGDMHGDGHGNCVPNDPTKDPNWPGNWYHSPGPARCYVQDRDGRVFSAHTTRAAVNKCLAANDYRSRTCRTLYCD
jgi:hypothetical protein